VQARDASPATTSGGGVTPQELAGDLLELWHFLIKGGAKALYALLDELDLSFSHVKTLHTLADVGEELSVKELAEHMGTSLASASRVADALHQRGLVDRREDERDRRTKRLRITDAGRDAVDRIDTVRLQSLAEFTASLSQEQRDRLHAALISLPHPRPRSRR
jgi:DNA-binding MarR family transcriptional regulator